MIDSNPFTMSSPNHHVSDITPEQRLQRLKWRDQHRQARLTGTRRGKYNPDRYDGMMVRPWIRTMALLKWKAEQTGEAGAATVACNWLEQLEARERKKLTRTEKARVKEIEWELRKQQESKG
jgi:hypothetical protein